MGGVKLRDPRRLKLLALGVGVSYLFLAAFLVLCLSHHDLAEGGGGHHDHQGWIKEICTWAQKTTASYVVPEAPELQALRNLPFEPFFRQSFHLQPLLQPPSIRAPPPSLLNSPVSS